MKNAFKIFGMLLAVCILFSCFTARADAADLNQLKYSTNSDGTITISGCDKNAEGELVIPDTIGGRKVTEIGGGTYTGAFAECNNLIKITMPSTLVKIGSNAFYHCTGLKEVVLQNGVKTIDERAFVGCSSLETILMPDTVTKLGKEVFWGCSSLKNVKLSNGLSELPYWGFHSCSSLRQITIPSSVTKINDSAFLGTGLTSLVIPSSVKEIYTFAFKDCKDLTRVTLNEGLQRMAFGVFENCTSLKAITIPDSVTALRDSMSIGSNFSGCTSLETVIIGSGVKNIPTATFSGCTSLHTVYMHSNVRNVYSKAFEECPSLTDIYYRGTQDQWTSTALDNGNDAMLLADVHYIDSFTDVATAAWYGPAVYWAVGQGITSGVGNHAFAPSMTCTNGQVITFLWVAAGTPTPTGSSPFSKVQNSNVYYYKPAVWAYEKGIITDTSFDPDAPATRANFVTYLWRYKGKPSVSRSNPFNDVKSSDPYYTAVMWALENDITSGTSATTFSPNATCTRGQIVTFLYGYFAR